MNTVFADTAFYIAFTNPRDQWHEIAVEVAFGWRGKIVTTDYVLV
jgi:predicted nucleic acid-binding protein